MQYRLYVIGAATLILLGAVLGYGHWRYHAGVAVTTDHYEALLSVASAAKAAADQKTRDADARADDITQRATLNAQSQVDSIAAERDATLASLHDYQSRSRHLILPQVAGPTISADVAARLAQCDRNDEAALNDAALAQSDAVSWLSLQNWYRDQQAAHRP